MLAWQPVCYELYNYGEEAISKSATPSFNTCKFRLCPSTQVKFDHIKIVQESSNVPQLKGLAHQTRYTVITIKADSGIYKHRVYCNHLDRAMEQSVAVDKFVTRIKQKYIERRLNRERQWPPCKSEKLVRLELVEGEQRQGYSAGQIRGRDCEAIGRNPLAYPDILNTKSGKKTVRKLLVEGDAGIGKTTLCTALSEDWANGKLFQEFEILLLLHLRQKKIPSAGSLLGLLKLLHSSYEICTLVAKLLY